MAEGIFSEKLKNTSLSVSLDSCGTGNYHVGEAPDNRAIETCLKHGIDISGLRARQFKQSDFDDFDYIFVMDKSNYHDVSVIANTTQQSMKVELFLNLIDPGKNRSVPDPYFGGEAGFEKVYEMLSNASDKLLEKLKDNND